MENQICLQRENQLLSGFYWILQGTSFWQCAIHQNSNLSTWLTSYIESCTKKNRKNCYGGLLNVANHTHQVVFSFGDVDVTQAKVFFIDLQCSLVIQLHLSHTQQTDTASILHCVPQKNVAVNLCQWLYQIFNSFQTSCIVRLCDRFAVKW